MKQPGAPYLDPEMWAFAARANHSAKIPNAILNPDMIHLHLQPEIEAQLAAEAAACGLQLDRYVEEIVAARPQPLDELRLQEELEQGLREIAEGKARPAREVFAALREEYGIRG